jgi:alcohol dehydrogenase
MQDAGLQQGYGFQTVGHIEAGAGAARRLGELLARYAGDAQGGAVLVVTDPGIRAGGLLEPALQSLRQAGFAPEVFDGVCADPPDHVVLQACTLARSAGARAVVGFGGGSSMDVAKIAACISHPEQSVELAQLYGVESVRVRRLPLLQVPTTAGTGSEVTRVAIVTTGATTKSGIVNGALLADAVVLDAELTLGLPAAVTAATGIDAMVHAIEAYTSAHRKNPMSDMLAREALRLLGANLLRAVQHGDDLAAREHMLRGAMLAGMAFDNAPVAAVHALAYPLGGLHHLPHGLSNSLVLPHVLRFNLPAACAHYAELAEVLLPRAGGGSEARAQALIEHLADLGARSGLPTRLRECGIAESGLELLAREAMGQQRLLRNNPRPVTEADALAVYRAAY